MDATEEKRQGERGVKMGKRREEREKELVRMKPQARKHRRGG